jgi:predicted Zn finger-like uncharacterized protein
MPPVKITCPECEAVLKVSTPPPGKKMKCPKCGEAFAVPRDASGVRAAAPAGGKKKPAAKKPDEPSRAPAPAKGPADDDDEDGGTYALIKDPDEEAAEDEEDEDEDEDEEDGKPRKKKGKPTDINYAPDLSIKDLRGPAQAAVIGPSNLLIIYGAVGFIGWLLVFFIVLIPIMFPVQDETASARESSKGDAVGPGLGAVATPNFDALKDKDKDKDKAKGDEGPPWTVVFGFDLAGLASLPPVVFIFAVIPVFILGMAYGGAIVVGGVKMQSLESRQWGLAASIMNMIPLHTFGLMILACVILQMLFIALFDDPGTVTLILVGLMVLLALLGALVGALGLKTLTREEVIAGFEYKAD